MQTRLVNQLTACLKAYFPVALNLFGKLQQRSTLLFLQAYPTLEAVRSASVEQFIAQLVQTGYPNPKKAAPKIFELVHQPQRQARPGPDCHVISLQLGLVDQLKLMT